MPTHHTYRITPQQIERARQLRAQGLSWPTIGKRLGLSGGGLRQAVEKTQKVELPKEDWEVEPRRPISRKERLCRRWGWMKG